MSLAALPKHENRAYLERVESKALTPRTVTEKSRLMEIIARVREEGSALADEELELGLRSLAVPLKTGRGEVIAAMNVGVHAARVPLAEMIERFLPILTEHARVLGQVLG